MITSNEFLNPIITEYRATVNSDNNLEKKAYLLALYLEHKYIIDKNKNSTGKVMGITINQLNIINSPQLAHIFRFRNEILHNETTINNQRIKNSTFTVNIMFFKHSDVDNFALISGLI